ncbi:Crp/Fnr family transcriptional regulator, partial [Desulfococcaceae bacterium OttesenSCG-928-F15]|nr:Crp/Fnr family transcriptional regulator [Desulfococcaceae bacterium OttesenSCG-928-F15]
YPIHLVYVVAFATRGEFTNMFGNIKRSPLFAGIDESQMESLLDCLGAVKRRYAKDEFIFVAGDKAKSVGIVLSGSVRVLQEDFWGYRGILAHIEPGGLFGEAFSCAEKDTLPVSVIASEASEILLVDYRKIVTTCSSACIFHTLLVMNMMRILAEKNILLTRKIEHLSKRSTREKLLSFLSAQAVSAKSTTIHLPFNRQELADYLCVDRSALSRELGAMQAEGLIRYEKNSFELIRTKN